MGTADEWLTMLLSQSLRGALHCMEHLVEGLMSVAERERVVHRLWVALVRGLLDDMLPRRLTGTRARRCCTC